MPKGETPREYLRAKRAGTLNGKTYSQFKAGGNGQQNQNNNSTSVKVETPEPVSVVQQSNVIDITGMYKRDTRNAVVTPEMKRTIDTILNDEAKQAVFRDLSQVNPTVGSGSYDARKYLVQGFNDAFNRVFYMTDREFRDGHYEKNRAAMDMSSYKKYSRQARTAKSAKRMTTLINTAAHAYGSAAGIMEAIKLRNNYDENGKRR